MYACDVVVDCEFSARGDLPKFRREIFIIHFWLAVKYLGSECKQYMAESDGVDNAPSVSRRLSQVVLAKYQSCPYMCLE